MNASAAILSISPSRPKVHRLPPKPCVSQRQRMTATVLGYVSAARFVFTLSSLALVMLLSALLFSGFFPLPALNQDTPHSATGLIGTVTVSEAIASTIVKDQGIVLTGQNGNRIVGQMMRMSAQPGAGAAAIISEVDKRRGQELLSIVNRTN